MNNKTVDPSSENNRKKEGTSAQSSNGGISHMLRNDPIKGNLNEFLSDADDVRLKRSGGSQMQQYYAAKDD